MSNAAKSLKISRCKLKTLFIKILDGSPPLGKKGRKPVKIDEEIKKEIIRYRSIFSVGYQRTYISLKDKFPNITEYYC